MSTHNLPHPRCVEDTLKELGQAAFNETVINGKEPYPEESQIYLTLIHLLDKGSISSTEYVKIDAFIKAGFLQAKFLHDLYIEKEKDVHNINKN